MTNNEILFEVEDTEEIILGTNLHIPNMSMMEDGYRFDWGQESMLIAMEMAEASGIRIPYTNYEEGKWYVNFNCKVNYITYNVIDTEKEMRITKIEI